MARRFMSMAAIWLRECSNRAERSTIEEALTLAPSQSPGPPGALGLLTAGASTSNGQPGSGAERFGSTATFGSVGEGEQFKA